MRTTAFAWRATPERAGLLPDLLRRFFVKRMTCPVHLDPQDAETRKARALPSTGPLTCAFSRPRLFSFFGDDGYFDIRLHVGREPHRHLVVEYQSIRRRRRRKIDADTLIFACTSANIK